MKKNDKNVISNTEIIDDDKIKYDFIQNLIALTKAMKIKSFQILKNDEKILIDFQNIKDFIDILYDVKILLAKKNMKLFDNESIKNYIIHNCTEEDPTIYDNKVLVNGKIVYFNIMNHAKIQFVKRYIMFLHEYKNEVKLFKNKDINSLIIKLASFIKYNNYPKISRSKELDEIIIDLISNSTNLNENNMGRHRDIRKFKARDQIHNQTSRFFIHPFLFILDNVEKKLVTTELYSSSFNVKIINDKVKHLSNDDFMKILSQVKNEEAKFFN